MDFVSCDKHGSMVLWNTTRWALIVHDLHFQLTFQVDRLMSVDTKMGVQPIMTFTGHSAKITSAHLNETYLATSSLDKTVRVGWVTCLSSSFIKLFHCNGALPWVNNLKKNIEMMQVWFLRTGELYRCIDFEGAVTCVSITPSLRHVLVGFNEARLSVIDITKESNESETTFIVKWVESLKPWHLFYAWLPSLISNMLTSYCIAHFENLHSYWTHN